MIAPYLLASIATLATVGICGAYRWRRSWQSASQVIAEAQRDVAEWCSTEPALRGQAARAHSPASPHAA